MNRSIFWLLVSKLTWGLLVTSVLVQAQQVAYEIKENGLIPEGIAYHAPSNRMFVSSILKNKILVIKGDSVNDFVSSGFEGFMGGLGLGVDEKHGLLWACSGDQVDNRFATGIFAFNLTNGALVQRYVIPPDTIGNFFNDLAITRNGDVFITNMYDHSIWRWGSGERNPWRWLTLDANSYPNGIVFNQDESRLFVATNMGLVSIGIESSYSVVLTMPPSTPSPRNLDGLAFYNKSIIAVQNASRDKAGHKIVRYYLTDDQSAILRSVIVDQGNLHFNIPTALAVHQGTMYLLANSQLDLLTRNKKMTEEGDAGITYILRYGLE